jgi:ubiquinone/menaquinone biosynthesis C-methylase UbiE
MILDVGCDFIQGKHKVDGDVGVDIRKGICHVQCGVHFLPFRDHVFSHVNMIAVLEHLNKPLIALREAKRVAKQHAIFNIIVPKDARGSWINLKRLIFEFPFSIPILIRFYYVGLKHKPIGHKRQVKVSDIAKVLKIVTVEIVRCHSWFRGKNNLLRKYSGFDGRMGMWKDLKILAVKT